MTVHDTVQKSFQHAGSNRILCLEELIVQTNKEEKYNSQKVCMGDSVNIRNG